MNTNPRTPTGLVLAVSSCGNDTEVLKLVAQLDCTTARSLFDRVFIVDSLGHGEIERTLNEPPFRDWVLYSNHAQNLGAAGNLMERLKAAASTKASHVFVVNHDGQLDFDLVSNLHQEALSSKHAAVYPLRRIASERFDLTGTRRFPWRSRRFSSHALPRDRRVAAFWSSSNGALYSLEPFRTGVHPPVELWHGWEDLAYGRLLMKAGYEQTTRIDLPIASRYDFETRTLAGRQALLASKPPWMNYYFSRNLLWIAMRSSPDLGALLGAKFRILSELVAILVFREDKLARLRYTLRGVVHAVTGRMGLQVLPK